MLLSLTVFMLLVAEIMPATSDSVPLIGETFFDDDLTLKKDERERRAIRMDYGGILSQTLICDVYVTFTLNNECVCKV